MGMVPHIWQARKYVCRPRAIVLFGTRQHSIIVDRKRQKNCIPSACLYSHILMNCRRAMLSSCSDVVGATRLHASRPGFERERATKARIRAHAHWRPPLLHHHPVAARQYVVEVVTIGVDGCAAACTPALGPHRGASCAKTKARFALRTESNNCEESLAQHQGDRLGQVQVPAQVRTRSTTGSQPRPSAGPRRTSAHSARHLAAQVCEYSVP